MAPKWNFIPTPKSGVHGDSSNDNFFMHDGGTVVDSLVRENIQNALDAKLHDQTVRVRFSIHQSPNSSVSFIKDILDDKDSSVIAHYNKAVIEKEGVPNRVDLNKPSFLLIEDFNTQGLRGDIKANDQGGFAMFWRNTGISDKNLGGNNGGSFGIGKVVNPMASEINTFFGLTIRSEEENNDNGPYLMGQVMLRTHHYKGKRYQPYALFGECRSETEAPISNEQYINKFKAASGISRNDSEPGFSLAIPFPKSEFNQRSIISAVLNHYFFPIVEKRLIVEVIVNSSPVVINSETIVQHASSFSPELGAQIDFAGQIVKHRRNAGRNFEAKLTTIDCYNDGLKETHFNPTVINEMRDAYENRDLVAIKVPIETLKKESETPESSQVQLYIKQSNLTGTFYIRAGISVYDNPKVPQHIKCMALLLAENGEIAELLRKSEGPAHTKWVLKNSQAVPIYEKATHAVSFVNGLLSNIAKLLENKPLNEDVDILADDFPDEGSGNPSDDSPDNPPDIDTEPAFVAITRKTEGDVIISQGPAMKDPNNINKIFEVTVQYLSAMRGAKWRPYDFDLSQLNIKIEGAKLLESSGNKLKVQLTDTFQIIIPGLDKRKDVKVNIESIA